MESRVDIRLEKIVLMLEKKYYYFKKMDVYTAVREAYKKVHSLIRHMADHDFEQVAKIADQDLGLS